jgi:murein DD-endopeptidase MepM/ murein hydrolase activator NlpD
MRPMIHTALILSGLLAAGSLLGRSSAGRNPGPPPAAHLAAAGSDLESLCPAHTLPDGQVCIPVPWDIGSLPDLTAERNAHRERSGQWRQYDQIPRLPDRPTKYEEYELPIAPTDRALAVSGYDLHLPDAMQRRGPHLSAVGHGGVDIVAPRGTQVHLVQLEHQVGDARVLYVGPLFGNTVVTHHVLREGGQQRDYLVLFGHLERPAPGLAPGQTLRKGSVIGLLGDSGSPGVVHLHLEMRRVRSGVDPDKLSSGQYAHNARTVACDPRNVLPLLR